VSKGSGVIVGRIYPLVDIEAGLCNPSSKKKVIRLHKIWNREYTQDGLELQDVGGKPENI
jgi:hypothetical protein